MAGMAVSGCKGAAADTIYTIKSNANHDEMGVVTGGGKYAAGAWVELAAWNATESRSAESSPSPLPDKATIIESKAFSYL